MANYEKVLSKVAEKAALYIPMLKKYVCLDKNRSLDVDILVNNAGHGYSEVFVANGDITLSESLADMRYPSHNCTCYTKLVVRTRELEEFLGMALDKDMMKDQEGIFYGKSNGIKCGLMRGTGSTIKLFFVNDRKS